MIRLGELADVDVGIVTGRNSFFTFTDAKAQALGLRAHCVPLVSRSAQLSGLIYDEDCRACDVAGNHRTWLLDAADYPTDPALVAHITAGEAAGVHLGYKCSIRKPWWSTPSLWMPDLFMLRQIHFAPRLTVNAAAATSTDTVHRVGSTRTSIRQLLPRCSTTARHSRSPRSWAAVMGAASWSWSLGKPSNYLYHRRRTGAQNLPRMLISC